MNTYARSLSRLFVFSFICVSLSACTGWSDAEEWGSSGLWSDDDQSILVHKHFFERTRKFGASHYTTRNFETQFYTVAANNLSALTPLGPRLTGRFNGGHFMNSAGYVVVERRKKPTTEGTTSKAQIYIDKISLNGSVDNIATLNGTTMLGCNNDGGSQTYPGPVDVVPNPDGSLLSIFQFDANCSGTTGTITFKNASDLSVVDGPSPLKMDEFNAAGSFFSFEEVWFQSGEVFAGFLGGFGASDYTGWKYAPGQDPIRVESVSQDCAFVNQYTNSQGQRADVRGNGDENPTITVVADPNFEAPTGCN